MQTTHYWMEPSRHPYTTVDLQSVDVHREANARTTQFDKWTVTGLEV